MAQDIAAYLEALDDNSDSEIDYESADATSWLELVDGLRFEHIYYALTHVRQALATVNGSA